MKEIRTTFGIWNLRENTKEFSSQEELNSFNNKKWISLEGHKKALEVQAKEFEDVIDDLSSKHRIDNEEGESFILYWDFIQEIKKHLKTKANRKVHKR